MSEPRTIDASRPSWGHNVTVTQVIDGGQKLRVAGWLGDIPEEGDFLILPNGGGTTRYRVDTLERRWDPKDMFFADLSFAPRYGTNDRTPHLHPLL